MTDYRRLYHVLFNASTNALRAQENRNYGHAAEILEAAQQLTEEDYIADPDVER